MEQLLTPIETSIINHIIEDPYADPNTLVVRAVKEVYGESERIAPWDRTGLVGFCRDVQEDYHVDLEIEAENVAYEADSFFRKLAQEDGDA